ncbi:MAG: TetR/AcrR family transcriptional regulator [Leptothrix sp. (in: Bacteria)]|nr:TetR/AcrR family transcriptional regulator [Leptothrix sp. (in: b-proteobacteria)]
MPNAEANPRATSDQATTLLDQAIAHVLEHGYSDQSLRSMAASLGTSHRMLSYYFGDVDGFWEAVVRRLRNTDHHRQAGMAEGQAFTVPPIEEVWRHFTSPSYLPVFQLMLEIYIKALRDRQRFGDFLAHAVDGWIGRVAQSLQTQHGLSKAKARIRARLELAIVRGLLLDLLTTGDKAGTSQAIKHYAQLIQQPRQETTP